MSQAVILFWVSATLSGVAADDVRPKPTSPAIGGWATTTQAAKPSREQQAALEAWAEARLLKLAPPKEEASSHWPSYSAVLVRRVESLLEQARLSAGSLDETLALEQLHHAESLVYDHPELPQASYLLAEAAWQQAALAERAGNAELSSIQRSRAETLEGSRARAYASAPEVQTSLTRASSTIVNQRLRVQGLTESDRLVWDGVLLETRHLSTRAGEHHAQVFREGQLAWAGFVMVASGATTLDLPLAAPAPCTRSDLASARIQHNRVLLDRAVRCPLWAVARPSNQKGVDIALCRHDSCGSLLNWREAFGAPLTEPLHARHPWRLPSWTIYLAAGVGAAAATGLTLWQAGAFDEPERAPATWSFGGVSE